MPVPFVLYGAASLASMGITALFRLASHPVTPKIINAATNSAATMGQTLSNGFNYASEAYDWLSGDDELDQNIRENDDQPQAAYTVTPPILSM